MYDALRPDSQPVASFWGHMNGSFYIRACFSPDGGHILSGSSDHKAYIWAVRGLSAPVNRSLIRSDVCSLSIHGSLFSNLVIRVCFTSDACYHPVRLLRSQGLHPGGARPVSPYSLSVLAPAVLSSDGQEVQITCLSFPRFQLSPDQTAHPSWRPAQCNGV